MFDLVMIVLGADAKGIPGWKTKLCIESQRSLKHADMSSMFHVVHRSARVTRAAQEAVIRVGLRMLEIDGGPNGTIAIGPRTRHDD